MKMSINKNSAISSIIDIPILNTPFASSFNYTNQNSDHPDIDTIIHCKDVVFQREHLGDNKWLMKAPNNCNLVDFEKEVLNIFNTWLRHNIHIVIQSGDNIARLQKERQDNRSKTEEKARQIHSQYPEYYFNRFDRDITKIPHEFIKRKYDAVIDLRQEKDLSLCALEKIEQTLNVNDEIWYYSDFDDSWLGNQIECILLIRNKSIVSSPLIRERNVCFASPKRDENNKPK